MIQSFGQKCPQFSQKTSPSIASMLALFCGSVNVHPEYKLGQMPQNNTIQKSLNNIYVKSIVTQSQKGSAIYVHNIMFSGLGQSNPINSLQTATTQFC